MENDKTFALSERVLIRFQAVREEEVAGQSVDPSTRSSSEATHWA
jgi:hypothetical protein